MAGRGDRLRKRRGRADDARPRSGFDLVRYRSAFVASTVHTYAAPLVRPATTIGATTPVFDALADDRGAGGRRVTQRGIRGDRMTTVARRCGERDRDLADARSDARRCRHAAEETPSRETRRCPATSNAPATDREGRRSAQPPVPLSLTRSTSPHEGPPNQSVKRPEAGCEPDRTIRSVTRSTTVENFDLFVSSHSPVRRRVIVHTAKRKHRRSTERHHRNGATRSSSWDCATRRSRPATPTRTRVMATPETAATRVARRRPDCSANSPGGEDDDQEHDERTIMVPTDRLEHPT